MRIVSQDYIVRDDLAADASLSIVVKKIKIIEYSFNKGHHSELLKQFRRQVRYVEKLSLLFF